MLGFFLPNNYDEQLMKDRNLKIKFMKTKGHHEIYVIKDLESQEFVLIIQRTRSNLSCAQKLPENFQSVDIEIESNSFKILSIDSRVQEFRFQT